MSESDSSSQKPSRSLSQHIWDMPRWQKSLLLLAVILLGAGVAGNLVTRFSAEPSPVERSAETATPDGARSFVATDPSVAPDREPAEQSKLQKYSPALTRMGFGFLAAFIVGFVFRMFLKMMTFIAVLGFAAIMALSYFNIMNIDFSAAEKKYETARGWLSDQGERAKTLVMDHIPGSAASAAGFFVGFRRRK